MNGTEYGIAQLGKCKEKLDLAFSGTLPLVLATLELTEDMPPPLQLEVEYVEFLVPPHKSQLLLVLSQQLNHLLHVSQFHILVNMYK